MLIALSSDLFSSLISLTAGLTMFKRAFLAVVRSPVAFFDTTPLGKSKLARSLYHADHCEGRIMSRLSKDQDTIDTELGLIANQVLITARFVTSIHDTDLALSWIADTFL